MTEEEAQPDEPQQADLVVVQIDETSAMVFGSSVPGDWDLAPLLGSTERDRNRITEAAALAVGGANVGLSLAPALAAAQGIVQLSPQTMAALQTLSPMVSASGQNLGVLVDATSKIGHVVQWSPAAATQGVTFAASMGTSVALIAIQLQLAEISRSVERNLELTGDVLDELHWKNDSEIAALHNSIRRSLHEAQRVGAVTPAIYAEIQGREHQLSGARDLLLRRLSSYAEEIESADNVDKRRKWITDRGDRCHRDLRSLVQIEQDWYAHQALRAASIAESDQTDRGRDLVDEIRVKARDEHEAIARRIMDAAERIHSQLGLLEGAHARQVGHFGGARKARNEAGRLRELIDEALPALQRGDLTAPPLVSIGDGASIQRGLRVIHWLHRDLGAILLAAEAEVAPGGHKALLVVTEDDVVVAKSADLTKRHRVDFRCRTSDIRYALRENKLNTVHLATTRGFFCLEFERATDEELAYATALLLSFASLPEGELVPRPQAVLPPGIQSN